MKRDVDDLMQANGIDALLVMGPAFHNPAMVYFTGGGHVSQADLIKPRGQGAILFHASMERDEAAKSGLKTRSYSDYPIADFLKETGDYTKAMGKRYARMLTDAGVTQGRVALYGQIEIGPTWAALQAAREHLPNVEFVGFPRDPILLPAMMTKDPDEIERIREAGRKTVAVVDRVAKYLSSRPVKDEVLQDSNGQPLTIGAVKGLINLWLAEAGMENPEATIFAIGRDGGVPHSSGEPSDVIRLGEPIVFDIFPCEAGGGYFYDFTRTWCVGYARDDVRHVFEQVQFVYDQVVSELKVNEPFKTYQQRTCELFEEMNHPTIASDPKTESGYVHSLGHGLGLHVHEKPFSGALSDDLDVLAPGTVFTIEPGLYYPEKGLGVRLEDSYVTTADGRFEKLVDYPMDLVLPLRPSEE